MRPVTRIRNCYSKVQASPQLPKDLISPLIFSFFSCKWCVFQLLMRCWSGAPHSRRVGGTMERSRQHLGSSLISTGWSYRSNASRNALLRSLKLRAICLRNFSPCRNLSIASDEPRSVSSAVRVIRLLYRCLHE